MHRKYETFFFLQLFVLLFFLSACGAGRLAQAIRSEESTYSKEMKGKNYTVTGFDVTALIVDWPLEFRGDLEIMMNKGVAVLSYQGENIRLLEDCFIDGSYSFMGMTIKEQLIRLENADEIRANLPLTGHPLALDLEEDLERGTTLDIALVFIGKKMSTWNAATYDDIKGQCEGATHFVRGVTVGAFSLQTGSRAQIKTVAEMFQRGMHASTSSSRNIHNKEGKIDDCYQAIPQKSSPPGQCSSPLRLQLKAIKNSKEKAERITIADNVCPEGLVLSEGKCTAPSLKTHLCKNDDFFDCKIQCEKSHSGSCFNLGVMYHKGKGVEKNYSQAAIFFSRACDDGSSGGCSELGRMYSEGKGVEQDYTRAVSFFERACNGGSSIGCSNLGVMYYTGRGVAQDYSRAASLFKNGCNGGSEDACFALGSMYFEGEGLEQNYVEAIARFAMACLFGNLHACGYNGVIYLEGKAVGQDYKKAFTYISFACGGGDLDSCDVLGRMYSEGKGVEQDYTRAVSFFERACNGRLAESCFALGLMYYLGKGVNNDDRQAVILFERACNGGLAESCYGLGRMYLSGEGVEKDDIRAESLFDRACKDGYSLACEDLSNLKSQ